MGPLAFVLALLACHQVVLERVDLDPKSSWCRARGFWVDDVDAGYGLSACPPHLHLHYGHCAPQSADRAASIPRS